MVPAPEPLLFVRLLGAAYLALLGGYYMGLKGITAGENPLPVLAFCKRCLGLHERLGIITTGRKFVPDDAPPEPEVEVVPALQERGARYRLSHISTTATQTAAGWTLNGQKSVVPAADEADAFIVPAQADGGILEGAIHRAPVGHGRAIDRDRAGRAVVNGVGS